MSDSPQLRRIINVANRLPVKAGAGASKPSGGLVSALGGLADKFEISWVGWSGSVPENDAARESIESELERKYNCHPIFLSHEEVDGYYHGFSNASLWPLLHYMQTYSRFEKGWFEVYEEVNRRFCQKIVDIAGPDDIVWIHDYHLMLLPAMLRRELPNLPIGFFLHTPFPSQELFRCHPRKIELMSGLLGADLIGFHTFGYLRHFRSCLLHLLGLESEIDRVSHGSQVSRIGVFPIGINWKNFQDTLGKPSFTDHLQRYKELFAGKKLVLSVGRMDYTKGIPQTMRAIEIFLRNNPDMSGSTAFVIIAIPTREKVDEYLQLNREVDSMIGRINGQYSSIEHIPVHFINHSVQFDELCALYSLADVALVTPLIDGMNLVAKEYIACQENKNGVLILSEFAGAAQELFNAIMVNPYDIDDVAAAIRTALRMPERDKAVKNAPMKERIIQHSVIQWAQSFINELSAANNVSRGLAVSTGLPSSIAERVKDAGGTVALFVDYDGTLRELVSSPNQADLNPEIRATLEHLFDNPHYRVHIISGRQMEFLQEQFQGLPVTLISEHGYAWSENGGPVSPLQQHVATGWKSRVIKVLRLYESSTPGSFVEEKSCSVVWHYRNSYPEFGKWKASALLGELTDVISNLPVEIHHGKKIVEVHSQQISKGNAVQTLMAKGGYSLGLCAGDDQTDETMFRLRDPNLISIKVGDGYSLARYRVATPHDFRSFLMQL